MARFDTIAVYIMTDKRHDALYTGVTSDLVTRVSKHRVGEFEGFISKYKCTRLVWYEVHADMKVAIQREKSIKRYMRAWKIDLIEAMNPGWNDLWSEIAPGPLPGQWRSIDEVRRGEFPEGSGEFP
jgi:putative endonuclease